MEPTLRPTGQPMAMTSRAIASATPSASFFWRGAGSASSNFPGMIVMPAPIVWGIGWASSGGESGSLTGS
jgi:hypothetical protein